MVAYRGNTTFVLAWNINRGVPRNGGQLEGALKVLEDSTFVFSPGDCSDFLSRGIAMDEIGKGGDRNEL
jgi:hypothetical protein